ncbi:MAG: creatininase family protein [Vicinamibacterales bacterium]
MTAHADRLWQAMTTIDAQRVAGRDPVVILPLASVEQHGQHLPLSTDLDIALGILDHALSVLPLDLPVYVLPAASVGASLEHARFPGTLSLDSDLLSRVIHAYGAAVSSAGAKRLVLFNSHGGNRHVLEQAALRLRHECGLLVVQANYFLFPRPDDVALPETEWLHAGAVETAMMLHLQPHLVRAMEVRHGSIAGTIGKHRYVGADGVAPFAWLAGDLHPSGAIGDPSLASAAFGRRLVEHYGQVLAEVIQETRVFPVDRLA